MNDTTTGPVTLDEVRAALASAGLDARSTNARALRELIGRGSMSTLQKHLETLRAAASQSMFEEEDDQPEPPKGIVDALWSSAYAAAKACMGDQMKKLLLQVDSLKSDVELLRADLEEAQAAADAAASAAEAAQAQLVIAQQEKLAAEASAKSCVEQIEKMKNEMALRQAQHEAAIASLQGEIDRLVSQLADYRAALGTLKS
jgi:chromosome segregation ATPase